MFDELDYEKEILKERIKSLENAKKILDNSNSVNDLPAWLKQKIDKHSKKYAGIESVEDIFASLKNNPNTITHYLKDPGKQSIHQNLAKNYIENRLSKYIKITNPEKLKNTFLTRNGIYTTEQLNGNKAESKSIDFLLEGCDNVYAITHKYTKEAGGSQDNQYADVHKFLKNAPSMPKHNEKNLFVVAIVDGNYYKNRILELRERYASKWYIIGNIEYVIKEIIKRESGWVD